MHVTVEQATDTGTELIGTLAWDGKKIVKHGHESVLDSLMATPTRGEDRKPIYADKNPEEFLRNFFRRSSSYVYISPPIGNKE